MSETYIRIYRETNSDMFIHRKITLQ